MFASRQKIVLPALLLSSLGLVQCGGDKSLLVGEERGGSELAGASGSGSSGSAGALSGGSGASASAGAGGTSGAGGSSGSGSGAPPSGGAGTGPGPRPDCMRMADDYRESLMGAQICMPGTPEPCTLMVMDALFCGCPTFVNPDRYPDVARMSYIIAAAAEACPQQQMCEPDECRPTSGGVCMGEQNQDPPRPHCFDVR